MSEDSKHFAWEMSKSIHCGGEDNMGCIWRHDYIKKEYYEGDCDYLYNGLSGSKDRTAMYDKDHRGNAKMLGYLEGLSDKVRRSEKAKARGWVKYQRPLEYLSHDNDAWHVDHTLDRNIVGGEKKLLFIKTKLERRYPQENFKARHLGGYGSVVPYYHQHHHIIPQGALRKYVIYGSTDAEPFDRVCVILSTNWNINLKRNIVILPTEDLIGLIAELPTHSGYHKEYSASLKTQLNDIRSKVDQALDTEDHEVIEKVKLDLDQLSDDLLEKIKGMESGKKISTVSFGGN